MCRRRRAVAHVAPATATTSTHSIEISCLQLAPQTACGFAVAQLINKVADAIVEDTATVRMTFLVCV